MGQEARQFKPKPGVDRKGINTSDAYKVRHRRGNRSRRGKPIGERQNTLDVSDVNKGALAFERNRAGSSRENFEKGDLALIAEGLKEYEDDEATGLDVSGVTVEAPSARDTGGDVKGFKMTEGGLEEVPIADIFYKEPNKMGSVKNERATQIMEARKSNRENDRMGSVPDKKVGEAMQAREFRKAEERIASRDKGKDVQFFKMGEGGLETISAEEANESSPDKIGSEPNERATRVMEERKRDKSQDVQMINTAELQKVAAGEQIKQATEKANAQRAVTKKPWWKIWG